MFHSCIPTAQRLCEEMTTPTVSCRVSQFISIFIQLFKYTQSQQKVQRKLKYFRQSVCSAQSIFNTTCERLCKQRCSSGQSIGQCRCRRETHCDTLPIKRQMKIKDQSNEECKATFGIIHDIRPRLNQACILTTGCQNIYISPELNQLGSNPTSKTHYID